MQHGSMFQAVRKMVEISGVRPDRVKDSHPNRHRKGTREMHHAPFAAQLFQGPAGMLRGLGNIISENRRIGSGSAETPRAQRKGDQAPGRQIPGAGRFESAQPAQGLPKAGKQGLFPRFPGTDTGGGDPVSPGLGVGQEPIQEIPGFGRMDGPVAARGPVLSIAEHPMTYRSFDTLSVSTGLPGAVARTPAMTRPLVQHASPDGRGTKTVNHLPDVALGVRSEMGVDARPSVGMQQVPHGPASEKRPIPRGNGARNSRNPHRMNGRGMSGRLPLARPPGKALAREADRPHVSASEPPDLANVTVHTAEGPARSAPQTPMTTQTQIMGSAGPIVTQIAAAMSGRGKDQVEIFLQPRELGKVKMSIRHTDKAILVHLVADRPETLDLMRRNSFMLEAELRQMGYGDVGFSFADGGQRHHPEPRQGDLARERPVPVVDRGGWAASVVSEKAIVPPVVADGRLDLRI